MSSQQIISGRPWRRPNRSQPRRIQSVGRALDIVFAIVRANQPLSSREVSSRLGLDRTTAYRLMVTLTASSLLRFDPATRKYRLGVGALEVGAAYLRSQIENRVVEQIIGELVAEVRHTVSLGALVDSEVVVTIAREANEMLTVTSRAGDRHPAHTSAIGKLFLAERSDSEVRSFLEMTGMRRLTPSTITSPGAFLREVAQVRARGIAFSREEIRVGVSSLAVPVRRPDGLLVAGLVVAVPAQFATNEAFTRLLPSLRRAARRIDASAVIQSL